MANMEIITQTTAEETTASKLPNFSIDRLPSLHVKSIHFQNFKAFKDCKFNFGKKKFVCFVGPNGTGKSTSLEIIQMIFSRYEGYDLQRLKAYLGKGVRHENMHQQFDGIYSDKDFLITAEIESEFGDYEVQLNKSGFVKDHPNEIKEIAYRICHTTGFDKDMKKFHVAREQWPTFKNAFEGITGYTIEEHKTAMDMETDPIQKELLEKYVLSFSVQKPYETILHKSCSDGERKLIKTLAALLSIEYTPKIVLIDNIEMHIEIKRHRPLISVLQKYFPDTQIFATTHSHQIARDLKNLDKIYDLRLISASDLIRNEPWRLYMLDEIDDYIYKAQLLSSDEKANEMTMIGREVRKKLMQNVDTAGVVEEAESFVKEVSENFVKDVVAIRGDNNIICN